MLSYRRSHRFGRVFNALVAVVLMGSFAAGWLVYSVAGGTTLYGVFAPLVIRDAKYEESIGVLDMMFSGDGWLLTNFAGSLDYGHAIALQADGKLVVAGSFDGTSRDFGLVRFNTDGSLDTTFDGDGRTNTDFFGNSDEANAIAVQSDGKIVLAGSAYNNATLKDDFALARYNPDGSLDITFGGDGRVTTDYSARAEYAKAVAVQADNKIIVAGYAYNGANYDFALARYNSDGTLDTTFDVDGKVITDFYGKSERAYALDLVGDKLVVAGETFNGSNYDFAMARYNANGTLDTDFGSSGKVFTDFAGGMDSGKDIVQQEGGKLIVTGSGELGDNIDFALARYNTDGSLDGSFGDEGKVTTDIFGGQDYSYGIIQQPDGKLVAVGYVFDGTQNDLAMARYDQVGVLDNTFDGDGKVITDFNDLSEWAYGLVRQDDGKLVLAGYMLTIAGSDYALARYTTSGALDLSFSEDGWVVTNLFGSNDQGMAAALQSGDKLVMAGWVQGSEGIDFAAARYYANGNPDGSFDVDGRLVTDLNGFDDYAYALAVQPDGRLVLAGGANNGNDDDFALVRYNLDGSLDTTFSSDGWLVTDFEADTDVAYGVLVQPDGKLVLAGEAGTENGADFALVRYNADGSLDSSFGTGGRVVTDFFGGDDHARAIVRQTDGKLLVAGSVYTGAEYDFAVARYTTSGALDTTFDGDGRVTTDINANDEGHALVLQADGKILAAGWTYNGTNDDIALVRYNTNGSLDNSFDSDGRVISNLSGSDERAMGVGLQPNGKVVITGLVKTTTGYDFALARYLSTGALDPTFSSDGWLPLDLYAGDDSGMAVVMLPGGPLVMAGYADNGTDYDFALVQYR